MCGSKRRRRKRRRRGGRGETESGKLRTDMEGKGGEIREREGRKK